MKVDVYSHSVHVTVDAVEKLWGLKGFLDHLTQWDTVIEDGETVMKAMKNFSIIQNENRTVSFHINLLDQFIKFYEANLYGKHDLKIKVHEFEIDDSYYVPLKVKNMFEPRENQLTVIEHLKDRNKPTYHKFGNVNVPVFDNNKIITMPTGEGKTFVSQYLLGKTKLRTMYLMRSSYIDRWVPDFEDTFHFKKGDIQIIRGGASLMAAMENAIDDTDRAKVYFVSTGTYTSYTDSWNKFGSQSPYPIDPLEFFKVMKIGRCVIDEGHQMPHQMMKYFCNLHIYDQNALSATLETMDKFMTKILEILYPTDKRCSGGEYAPHIKVTALKWRLGDPRRVSYMGAKGYNHAKFETSLLKKGNKAVLNDYLELTYSVLKERYYDKKLDGTKALVFFATIDMCNAASEYFQSKMIDKKVTRYVGSLDKMTVMDDADVIVSTVQSCGTAVDIPNLLTSIMTTAIDSQQSNEQTVGRTRPLKKYPDISPEFIYFLCDDIQRHHDYHRNKLKFFTKKALSHELYDSETMVGKRPADFDPFSYQQKLNNAGANRQWGGGWKNKGGNSGGKFNKHFDEKKANAHFHRNKHMSRPNFNRGNRAVFKGGTGSFPGVYGD